MNLTALNTKAVGLSGVLTFIVGLLCYGPFQTAITKATNATVAEWLGIAFIVAGFAQAYYGMPHSVPAAVPQPVAPPAAAPPSAPADATKGN